MNRITDKLQTGTLGELLVQIRLLQHGVQAAPPIKDSGNDLIAVNGHEFRAVSVRTITKGRYTKPKGATLYDVLAVVLLLGDGRDVQLDRSQIFLIPSDEVPAASRTPSKLGAYKFCRQSVQNLFGDLPPE
jgi:hypothetical protein